MRHTLTSPLGQHVRINGIRQHFLHFPGDGPSLVVVPGIVSPAILWRHVGEQIAPAYNCFVLDVRGRGLSEAGAHLDYGVGACALDVIAFAAAMQLKKATVVGHSMGGHGALVCALRHPGRYRSVSAFAPIVNPMNCPWGEKAFSRYLGEERSRWREWDACALLAEATEKLPILVDQGDRDDFLETQLKPAALKSAAQAAGHPLTLRLQPGYDHSYYFIASFIDDHLRHHAAALHQA